MISKLSLLLSILYLPLLSSCGKGVVGGTTAKLSFSGTSVSAITNDAVDNFLDQTQWQFASTATSTPHKFEVKFLAAYLAQDINSDLSNSGHVQKIYSNPECSLEGCSGTDQVAGFFDFSRPISQVNAEINSQKLVIEPDKTFSYKYVRLQFCIGSGKKNAKFKVSADSAETIYDSSNCTVNSAELSPPLTVNYGDQVTINLAYSLEGTLISCGSPGTNNCSTEGKQMTFPKFYPTASK